MHQVLKSGRARIVAASAAFLPVLAQAQETFAVPAEVAAGKTFVLAVGLAVLGVMVGIKVYKWAKRAL